MSNKDKQNTRNRPVADVTPADAATMGLQGGDPREPNAKKRPKRVPLSNGMNLDVSEYEFDREAYAYRFFLDDVSKPGRIESAKAAYWEHCQTPDGSNITRPAGPSTFYLMRLPIEYHNEDLALKKEKVQATMEAEAQIGANEYAPDRETGRAEGGKSAVTRTADSSNPFDK